MGSLLHCAEPWYEPGLSWISREDTSVDSAMVVQIPSALAGKYCMANGAVHSESFELVLRSYKPIFVYTVACERANVHSVRITEKKILVCMCGFF